MPDTNKKTEVVYTSAYPITFPTVDILPTNSKKQMLLARKPGRTKWRMIGGFVDVHKQYDKIIGLENNAARELKEEAGLDIDSSFFRYMGSFYVNDHRYVNSPNCIITAMFNVFVPDEMVDKAKASDDIEEVKWFDVFGEIPEIDYDHKEVIELVLQSMKKQIGQLP